MIYSRIYDIKSTIYYRLTSDDFYDIFLLNMKFSIEPLSNLWQKTASLLHSKKSSPRTIADYNREALINSGRQQFKKLTDLGLNIPVNLT